MVPRAHAAAALLCAPMLMLLACGDTTPVEPAALTTHAAPISGGYSTSGDRAVVGIVNIGNGGLGICSGTLIAPNLVLTAQHCIAPTLNQVQGGVSCPVTRFGSAYAPSGVFVTTEPQLSQNPALYVGVQEVLTPPDGSREFCGRDMAMLVLTTSIFPENAAPLTPRIDSLIEGSVNGGDPDIYSAVGYGEVGDQAGGSGQRRRRDDLGVQCVHQACSVVPGVTEAEWIGQAGVCSGDSGGPALDAAGRVIGVVSRGGQDCSFPVYGSVYAWRTWIIETAVRAAEVGQYEAPLWAQGWPTDPSFYAPVGAACETNGVCGDGFCIGGGCTRSCDEFAQCPYGYDCAGGRCAVGAGFTCTYEGCTLVPVGDSCGGDTDCPDGLCRDGYCTRGCDENATCPNGYACDAALCALIEVGGGCEASDVCGAGVCGDEGLCTRGCDALAPCPDGFSCDGGQCGLTTVGGLCETDENCADGMCGADGQCTRVCSERAPCPDGYRCGEAGVCSEILPASSDGCSGGGNSAPWLLLALALGFSAPRRKRQNLATT